MAFCQKTEFQKHDLDVFSMVALFMTPREIGKEKKNQCLVDSGSKLIIHRTDIPSMQERAHEVSAAISGYRYGLAVQVLAGIMVVNLWLYCIEKHCSCRSPGVVRRSLYASVFSSKFKLS